MNDEYRAKIRDQTYIRQIYESLNLDKIEERKLEKVSHLTTLVAYHGDMLQRIIEVRLLPFILKLMDAKYSVTVRSNAVLAVSFLTDHPVLYKELLTMNVIDTIMGLCMDAKQE